MACPQRRRARRLAGVARSSPVDRDRPHAPVRTAHRLRLSRAAPPRGGSGRDRRPLERASAQISTEHVPAAGCEHQRDLLRHAPPVEVTEPRHPEESPASRRLDPPHQGQPPLRCRPPHDPRRARLRASRAVRRAMPVRRERERDRTGSVQATQHQATRTDDQDRPALTAPVAPQLHHESLWTSPCRLRTHHLTLHHAVTDDHEPIAHRLGGSLAARARPRPSRGARRYPFEPGLDSQHARDKPLRASRLPCLWREARRRGRSRQEAPSPSPLSARALLSPLFYWTAAARRCPSPRRGGRPGGSPPGASSPLSPSRRGAAHGREDDGHRPGGCAETPRR